MRLERCKPRHTERTTRLEICNEPLRPSLDRAARIAGHHGADGARFQQTAIASAERITEHGRTETPQTREPCRMARQVAGEKRQQRIPMREGAIEVEERHGTCSGERAIDGARGGSVHRITN